MPMKYKAKYITNTKTLKQTIYQFETYNFQSMTTRIDKSSVSYKVNKPTASLWCPYKTYKYEKGLLITVTNIQNTNEV